MTISGKTRIISLLGYPVEHTLSPGMHNMAFEILGLDYCYVAFPVKPEMLGAAAEGLRALNLAGANVTVPHKENIIPFLDEVNEEAAFIGAVNTIVNRDGKLTGYNTDGRGFMRSLSEEGVEVDGRKVLVVGAGGASRAISYYLTQKASQLFIFDVDKAKALKLSSDLSKLRSNVVNLDALEGLSAMDIIINATPLGLKPDAPLPFDPVGIGGGGAVVDLIYKITPLQKEASARGIKTVNGLGMLLWQGVYAFELWTGSKPPHEEMRNFLLRAIK